MYAEGRHGLLNAPTGSGKTYAVWLGILADALSRGHAAPAAAHAGLRVLWITPLRALAKDIRRTMQEAADQTGTGWTVGMRTGDTEAAEKARLRRQQPECLVITPESLHLLLAQKDWPSLFDALDAVVVDEWHELLGTKRGVQVELAVSALRALRPTLRIWGISATIGNLHEAADVLAGPNTPVIRAQVPRQLEIHSLMPEEVELLPWSGHLGLKLARLVLPVIAQSRTTLLFTNTRPACELWYRQLLEIAPELAGAMAMHHGSIDASLRAWVEEALHAGTLKLVVCTSSLDLGVDFRPVETVIQIGSPRGVGRFLQRAGRSGHRPGVPSRIYFLPTNALELAEAAALRQAALLSLGPSDDQPLPIESRSPLRLCMDVLVQYLVTRATGGGFEADQVCREVRSTACYRDLSDEQWQWCLHFITTGGNSLGAYEEFHKVWLLEDRYHIASKKAALRHRLSIGTIVSEPMIKVQYVSGGFLGTVEEYFASKLKPGDVFWIGGKNVEFVRIQDMTVQVSRSRSTKGLVPAWTGGRLPLSTELSALLRQKLANGHHETDPEMQHLRPLLDLQARWSRIPAPDELLIEQFETGEGHHLVFYPFEGRMVHEVMGAMIAYRLSQLQPVTFSIAMNDYGFELLSDVPVDIHHALGTGLFGQENLLEDIRHSINNAEMARRRFREIAAIAGLIFQGYPGKSKSNRHLQASSKLIFEVFWEYDQDNWLIRQAYDEVMEGQLEHDRLRKALQRIQAGQVSVLRPPKPTPFAFPILTDRLRATVSSEKIEDRIAKMQLVILKDID